MDGKKFNADLMYNDERPVHGRSSQASDLYKDDDDVTTDPGQTTKNCKYCNRGFEVNRLVKHEEICQKVITKKREIFKSSDQRLSGIDYKILQTPPCDEVALMGIGAKKQNWRIAHEKFLKKVRRERIKYKHRKARYDWPKEKNIHVTFYYSRCVCNKKADITIYD